MWKTNCNIYNKQNIKLNNNIKGGLYLWKQIKKEVNFQLKI